MVAPHVHRVLIALLTTAILQCCMVAWILLHGPGGKLMDCMMPPCKRSYPIWLALAVFAFVAAVAARMLMAPDHVSSFMSNAIIFGTIGIAIVNLLVDLHFAHPIPHSGISLNMLMHSDITPAEQALLPLGVVILSVIVMGLNLMAHRALGSMKQVQLASKAR